MDDLHDRTRFCDLNKPIVSAESKVSDDRTEVKSGFLSPIFKTVNYKSNKPTPSRTGYSESSDYDFPSYQINQSVNKRTSCKSENETNDISLPLSPVLSPVIRSSHGFRPPSIHTLDTIAKRCNLKTAVKKDSKTCVKNNSKESETRRKSKIYENLQMTDLDISWVSSMASPPAPVPNSEFNTIERATFFPSEKFQKIQPRALFSPTSDDNCGCSLLPMSSSSEDEEEAYRTKMRLSDVCTTLRQLEFKSQDLNMTQENEKEKKSKLLKSWKDDDDDDDYYCHTKSPVFVVKPVKAKEKKKMPIVCTPEDLLNNEFSPEKCGVEEVLDKTLSPVNPVISDQLCKNFSGKEDESFLNISFTQIDNMCDSLLNPATKIKESSEPVPLSNNVISKKSADIKCRTYDESAKHVVMRHFYPSECSTNVEPTGKYFSSYDEIHNSNPSIFFQNKMHHINKFNSHGNSNIKLTQNTGTITKIHESQEEVKTKSHEEQDSIKAHQPPRDESEPKKKERKVNVLEMLDEEERMLQAVEEAEKTLAEEAQLIRAMDEMESTLVPHLSSHASKTLQCIDHQSDDKNDSAIGKSGKIESTIPEFSLPKLLCDEFVNVKFGFSTASGSKVTVSKEAMEKAKKLMELCDEGEKGVGEKLEESSLHSIENQIATEQSSQFIPKTEQSKNFNVEKKEIPLELPRQNMPDESNESVNVSECRIDSEERIHCKNFDFNFSTASGLRVTVSKKSLLKAQELMAKCDKNESPKKRSDRSFGSEPVRTSTPLPFPDDLKEACERENWNKSTEFQGNSTKITEMSLGEKGDGSEFGDEPDDRPSTSGMLPTFKLSEISSNIGFSTASGSKVSVSTKALNKAKEFLAECDAESSINENFSSFRPDALRMSTPKQIYRNSAGNRLRKTVLESGLGSKLLSKINEESNLGETIADSATREQIKRNFGEGPPSVIIDSMTDCANVGETSSSNAAIFDSVSNNSKLELGFSTASGLKVSVSNKALHKARELMAECDGDVSLTKVQDDSFATNSVKTSTPKPASIEPKQIYGKRRFKGEGKLAYQRRIAGEDEASILRTRENTSEVKNLPNESVILSNASKNETKFSFDFSTASGLKVSVSEEALKKGKMLLAECSKEDSNAEPEVKGFATEQVPEMKESKNSHFGFTTCLGKRVDVSEEALRRGRELMSSCDENRTDYLGCENESKPDKIMISRGENSGFPKESVLSKRQKRTIEGRFKSDMTEGQNKPELETPIPLPVGNFGEIDEGSIPADEWDKSFTIDTNSNDGERFKKRKLTQEDESEPESKVEQVRNKLSSPDKKTGTKRLMEENLGPSKRVKYACTLDPVSVKDERLKARQKLNDIIIGKGNVKPVIGSHLEKKTSVKQRPLLEVVENNIPLPREEKYGSESLTEATSFRFRLGEIPGFESAVSIRLDDDFVVVPDDEGTFGLEEIKNGFLAGPGVQPNLVPPNWVENHYKWIIWKLINYEKVFPTYFSGKTLTLNNVMLQMKYRYDREIDRHERSALKKILEKDDASIKRLVLRVSAIKKETTGYELELTDGWYSCPAKVDAAMVKLIESDKVNIGMKLITQGAVLMNCDQGMSPLELTESVHLKIFTNSTRRVPWNTKLGFQRNPSNITVNLDSISPDGGPISRVDAIVVRVYPLLYSEKTSDGRRVVRNRRGEEKAESDYRKILEQKMEKIYNQVRAEIRWKGEKKSEESLSQDVEFSPSPSRRRDRLNKEISWRIEEKLRKENLTRRDVAEVLKVKIVDLRKPNFSEPTILSIWGPGEDIVGLFAEGKSISLMNLTVSNFTREKKINATRQTRFKMLNRSSRYPARRLTPLGNISIREAPTFGEIDLVGIVVTVENVSHSSTVSQTIYLADSELNFVGLSFWGGTKNYGWENVLIRRRVVACSNLYWKSGMRKGEVPVLEAKETSLFTENPKTDHLKVGAEKLKGDLPKDLNDFLSECEEKLTMKLEGSNLDENVSSVVVADDETEAETSVAALAPTERQQPTKQFGKTQRFGGKSTTSSFRWLPYKNV